MDKHKGKLLEDPKFNWEKKYCLKGESFWHASYAVSDFVMV
jgi:hypothetical protein